MIAAFNERIKEYLKLRERLVAKSDKPSKESKPAEIEAYQITLAEQIKVARHNAKAGDLITPDLARHIRSVIKENFQGERLRELRETAQSAEVKGVAVRVNALYPESKELAEVPPTLLLKLPELPQALRYRLVGRSLLLMDREARLILDYAPDALP